MTNSDAISAPSGNASPPVTAPQSAFPEVKIDVYGNSCLVGRGRTWTDNVKTVHDDGRESGTIYPKRCCNGCFSAIGDVTETEIDAVIAGDGLPDVTKDCYTCTPPTRQELRAAERTTDTSALSL